MKLFWDYVGSKRWTIGAFFLFALLLTASAVLFRLPVSAVLYPMALCCLIGAIFLLLGFMKTKRMCAAIDRLSELSAEVMEHFPEPKTPEEEKLIELCRRLCRENTEIRAEDYMRYSGMVDYYTVWAHQIKTPIAAMKLTIQNEDSAAARRLGTDLLRIEQYVDMVMAYLRLESESGDYVFRHIELDDVLRPSLRKFAFEFIDRRLHIDYEPTGVSLISDEKWLAFVIEQLLSNALKYTREGGVKIYIREPLTLCIEDSGIGIAEADLPRIFERGYTGYNGRLDRSASGIGLYLCRRVCEKLGIGISAVSEPDKGTCVMLDLSQRTMKFE